MTEQSKSESVRRDVTVEIPVERAFQLFTARFDSWWPRSHHIGKAEMKEAVIEARSGGRWFERGVDGSECEWGRVLVWEPPRRVVLSWHLNHEWKYVPDPARASEVEVRFHAETPSRTRVELEHRHIERHGEGYERIVTGVSEEGGWGGILAGFAERARAA